MFPRIVCQFCGTELQNMRWRLIGVCGASKCQLAWAGFLQARKREEMQKKNEMRDRLAQEHLVEEAARLGIGQLESLLPVVVPANLNEVLNLPDRKKRAFRDYLMDLIAKAAAVIASSASPPSGESSQDSPHQPPELEALLLRGCSTCRGRCCNGGGNHAYLNIETILNYMHRHPKQRPRDVLDAYMSLLPNKAYENSCVYHAKNGCALPRDMRAKISGDFYCEELRRFQQQYYAGEKRKIKFYAIEENQVLRTEPLEKTAAEEPSIR